MHAAQLQYGIAFPGFIMLDDLDVLRQSIHRLIPDIRQSTRRADIRRGH